LRPTATIDRIRMAGTITSDASHAGGSALITDLASRAELNGTRVKLQRWVDDRERWRCKRKDTGEDLGLKLGNLTPEGTTLPPLLSAAAMDCTSGDLGLIRAWLGSGGDIEARLRSVPANLGETLLMCACWVGHTECLAELIRRGADVNARSDVGATALMASLRHPSVVQLLLEAGAHTHLRWVGPGPTDAYGLAAGTALDNAERLGHKESAALLRRHAVAADESAPRRDVFEQEREVLMKVLAADLLAKQARMGDAKKAERQEWIQQTISAAFADAADAASLSQRFARHADGRLDAGHWRTVAAAEADHLARQPRFKQVSTEICDKLPGFMEHLSSMASLEDYKGFG